MPETTTSAQIKTLSRHLMWCDSYSSAPMPLPDWASWLCSLGESAAGWALPSQSGHTWNLAVSLPARPLAWLFITASLIHNRARRPVEGRNIHEHYDYLKSHCLRQSVVLLTKRSGSWHRKKAILESVEQDDEGEYLNLLLLDTARSKRKKKGPAGGEWLKQYAPPMRREESFRVVLDDSGSEPVLARRSKGHPVVEDSKFFELLMGHETDLPLMSRLDTLVVGAKGAHLTEMSEEFKLHAGGSLNGGQLIDLIRPSCLYAYGQSFRSNFLSAVTRRRPDLEAWPNCLVMFDSALSYIRNVGHYPSHHKIALIGRMDSHYDEAMDMISSQATKRANDDFPPLPSTVPPLSIAVNAFSSSLSDL